MEKEEMAKLNDIQSISGFVEKQRRRTIKLWYRQRMKYELQRFQEDAWKSANFYFALIK